MDTCSHPNFDPNIHNKCPTCEPFKTNKEYINQMYLNNLNEINQKNNYNWKQLIVRISTNFISQTPTEVFIVRNYYNQKPL